MKVLHVIMVFVLICSCGKKTDLEDNKLNVTSDVFMASQENYSLSKLNDVPNLNTDLKEQFVCKINKIVNSINFEILLERNQFINLIERISSNEINHSEKEWLVEMLMKYRLIDKDKYFYSVTTYTSNEISNLLKKESKNYYKRNGLPQSCKYVSYNNKKFLTITKPLDSIECKEEFLRRAQVIAPGMAVTQATLESAWGNSRFAIEGNNLFGLQFRFSDPSEVLTRKYCLKAKQAPNRCVFKFINMDDAVREYYRFLNAGTYQPQFRKIRGREDIQITSCNDASTMIQGLTNYAENNNYISDVLQRMDSVCQMINNCLEN